MDRDVTEESNTIIQINQVLSVGGSLGENLKADWEQEFTTQLLY